MIRLIDSHAHLNDGEYEADRETIVKNFDKDGIEAVVNVGFDALSSSESVKLAEKHSKIYAAVGFHPHHASEYGVDGERIVRELASNNKTVAIGEIGLDYHYDLSPRDVQREVFKKQLELADELCLPAVIHSRDACADTMEILKSCHKDGKKVLLHCFSGSVETMFDYVKMGYSIALGGAVTFKNARVPKEVAKSVPLENLLLETDCPYMTPVPHRGKRNEPAYILLTLYEIAELRGMNPEDLADATSANARKFFNLR